MLYEFMLRCSCLHMKVLFACTLNNCMHAERFIEIIPDGALAWRHTLIYLACMLQLICMKYAYNNDIFIRTKLSWNIYVVKVNVNFLRKACYKPQKRQKTLIFVVKLKRKKTKIHALLHACLVSTTLMPMPLELLICPEHNHGGSSLGRKSGSVDRTQVVYLPEI